MPGLLPLLKSVEGELMEYTEVSALELDLVHPAAGSLSPT